ncbi:MAG TPA: hypothetical protein K8V51_04315 [Campylobacter avium]|uniref:hypothetical protein n=1 Tax=Campylobacter avium TaxID=522485 RepID=UPI001D51174E|nr:hypothetical protein [Campylobacter avium]HJE66271.1 hypothetical protein [Campylobacter avium]
MVNFNTNIYNTNHIQKSENSFLSNDKSKISKEDLNSLKNLLEKAYYYGDPEIEMVEGSILQRMMDNDLSVFENKMLNDLESDGEYIPSSLSYFDINREKYTLMKTMTSVSDFVKTWREIKEERKKEFFDEFLAREIDEADIKKYLERQSSNSQENTEANTNSTSKENNPFTPIQAESKSETFTYDDIAKNFFLTFLENERKKGTDILELLENLFKIDKNKVDLKA